MTTLSLGQEWVSRVTNADQLDGSVVGVADCPLPSAEEMSEFADELSRSETVREMSRRKWLRTATTSTAARQTVAERGEALREFMTINRAISPGSAMFRGKRSTPRNGLFDELATRAWVARVTDVAMERTRAAPFHAGSVGPDFLNSLAKLSVDENGPRRALGALEEIGISVVLESGLPGMSVDGAAFHTPDIGAVIALTVRHDRLDNFWFTLFHEVGHLCLHLAKPSKEIFVDSEEGSELGGIQAEAEAEADAFAKDNLIHRDTWVRSDARRLGNEASVLALARQLGIHPAIVAGRIRFERREFHIFDRLVGRGLVREALFSI